MTFLVIPIAAWSKLGTEINWADLCDATKSPVLSGLLAGAAGLHVKGANGIGCHCGRYFLC
jgi:hypothetical protein